MRSAISCVDPWHARRNAARDLVGDRPGLACNVRGRYTVLRPTADQENLVVLTRIADVRDIEQRPIHRNAADYRSDVAPYNRFAAIGQGARITVGVSDRNQRDRRIAFCYIRASVTESLAGRDMF